MIWPFNRKKTVQPAPATEPKPEPTPRSGTFGGFSTHRNYNVDPEQVSRIAFPVQGVKQLDGKGKAMDEDCGLPVNSAPYRFANNFGGVPNNVMGWFLSQGFIGHQFCAVMAQQWLVNRACKIPAEDACRNGWRVGVDEERVTQLDRLDKDWKIKKKTEEFARFNRVFGIRIALFVVESPDPHYYEKPFNIDGVARDSYKGISQIDPMWCAAELEGADVTDPASCTFYEPTFWRIGNRRIHRSHLVIIRYAEVPDLLKPTYQFGGLPLPQLIWERVYGAERSANEGPQLLLTKRMNIVKTDLEAVAADPDKFTEKMLEFVERRDNYGVLPVDLGDEYAQHDTNLGDVDAVIMTGYQLVAAVAEMPATKLLGTSPKGFNPTGDFESAAYRETLASIQEHHLTPFLDRHYSLAQKSLFGDVQDFEVVWNPLDEPSEKEQADTELVKMQTAQGYQAMGVLPAEAVERKLADDENSGWSQYIKDIEEQNGAEAEADRKLAAAIQSFIAGTGVQPAPAQANPVDDNGSSGSAQPEQQPVSDDRGIVAALLNSV